jgi:hypothetical protein
MRALIATHGHCFDGFASAAVFSRMLTELHGPELTAEFAACGYSPGQLLASNSLFTGDVNALLDYRYTPSQNLTWYFDHHRTAFGSAADHEDFLSKVTTQRYYFDASYGSCTKLIYDTAQRLGYLGGADAALAELVSWADIIDTARFSSAHAATDRSDPVLQLASVIELHGDDVFLNKWLPLLHERSVRALSEDAEIQSLYAIIASRTERFTALVSAKARRIGRVVLVDLTEKPVDLVGKFVTYALYPDCVYSVLVARQKRGFKLSVGYNPWCGFSNELDISAICARYGGGGHRVVGGISLDQHGLACALAESIAGELNGDPPSLPALP